MKNKGFTLVEILAVIVILAIVALIAMPIVSTISEKTKQSAYDNTIKNIEKAADNYSIYTNLGYDTNYNVLTINTLKESGYLEDKDAIDPRNGNSINGCILYRWVSDKKSYEFKYSETCSY